MTSRTAFGYQLHNPEVIDEVLERLESTFEARYARWVELAPKQRRAQRAYRDEYKRRLKEASENAK